MQVELGILGPLCQTRPSLVFKKIGPNTGSIPPQPLDAPKAQSNKNNVDSDSKAPATYVPGSILRLRKYRGFLPSGLCDDLRLTKKEAKLVEQLFAGKQRVPVVSIPAHIRKRIARTIEPELRGLVSGQIHRGLSSNPFNFAALTNASDVEQTALRTYLSPRFVRLPIKTKKNTLHTLRRVLLPKGRLELQRLHLPLPFRADGRSQPLTFSMEAEASLLRRPEILNFYAPSADGTLDPRALTDSFMSGLSSINEAWLRMTPAHKREQLRWKDLNLKTRRAYLLNYKKHVDEKVTLHRIADPKAAPLGRLMPETLGEKLVWEGKPLGTAEVVTETYYESLDLLLADVDFVDTLGEYRPGFHIHHVVEMSTPEDVKRLGPPATGLAALTDLFLFTKSVATGGTLLTNTHLEVWQAEGINEVARSLATGVIDDDVIDVHKFHCVGMREGLYGDDEKRLGLEVRAVRCGDNKTLNWITGVVSNILSSDRLAAFEPKPPWDFWNAGDKKLPDRAYQAARADPKLKDLAEGAEVEFSTILEMAAEPHTSRDTPRFASPLWNFEALPGMTDEDKERIGAARDAFVRTLMEHSCALTVALESDREIDSYTVKAEVGQAVRRFFRKAEIHGVLQRMLTEKARRGNAP